jgi:hypothetical protein
MRLLQAGGLDQGSTCVTSHPGTEREQPPVSERLPPALPPANVTDPNAIATWPAQPHRDLESRRRRQRDACREVPDLRA